MIIIMFAALSMGVARPNSVNKDSGVKDSLGRTVPADSDAVIALSPAITELVYALGLDKKLVGVSDFSDYPEEAKKKAHVGAYTNPSPEEIAHLMPDLVILPQEGPEDIRTQLDRLTIPYAIVKMRTLADIGKTAEQISAWLGDAKKGKDWADGFNRKMTHIFNNKPSQNLRHPKTLIEIQSEPLIAAGKDTFLNEIVTKCGGANVVTQENYPKVSLETLVRKNIELIFLADHFASDDEKARAQKKWKDFPSTKDAKIFTLDPDTTSRPGPRLIQGMEKICNLITESQN